MRKHYGLSRLTDITVIGRSLCGLVLGLALWAEAVAAETYFLSPTGGDSNSGLTQTSPWRTFQFAISRLRPGDTLTLLDGTYDTANSGVPVFSNVNGTATQPITIKALNERKAHIHNDGATDSVTGSKCSYLVFEGIQVSGQDNVSSTSHGGGIDFKDSHHLVFKRLLVHHNNRYANSHLLTLVRVTDSLVEESEFYYFHRHAVMTKPGSRNVFRRLYCHSRGYGNIPGGYPNVYGATWGAVCVSLYPADSSIVENTIADATTGSVFDIQASGPTPADNNHLLGNIALNTYYGAVIKARSEPGNNALAMPKNNLVINFVTIGAYGTAIYFRGVRGQRCDHCMFLNNLNGSGMVVDVETGALGDGVYSFSSDNSLSLSNGGAGVRVTSQVQTWSINSPNSYGNQLNYDPTASTNYVTSKSLNPSLGACKVWIPDSSPLKRAGKNGEDIGANILYRYQDGVLTTVPLWDQETGEFPHGALVTGVNDVPGQSLFDVHKRLNVNTNGCSFPANYGNSGRSTTVSAPVLSIR